MREDRFDWKDAEAGQVFGEALGAASACWEDISKAGVFDTTTCLEVLEELRTEMRARANRMHAIVFKFEDFFDEISKLTSLNEEEEDKFYDDWHESTIDPLKGLVCSLVGHQPVDDQCGNPDHRYCSMCGKLTPGEVTTKWVLRE